MLFNKLKFLKNWCMLLFIYLLFSSSTFAGESDSYNFKWTITSESGGFTVSSNYSLFETFGFPMFGSMSSSSYNLSGGAATPTNVNDIRKDRMKPDNFELQQNYPNPFNPVTNIQFELPEAAHVELVIYNVLGQKVKELVNKEFQAGYHNLIWHGTNQNGEHVGSGTYIFVIRVKSDNKVLFQDSKKMSFLK